jgi:queuine tRNA-ribosyltransferase catalytic subunit
MSQRRYPTRTARFGTALVPEGTMKLRHGSFKLDARPVDADCGCSTCRDYTRSALHHLFHQGTTLAGQLLTIHNIAYMMRLVRGMRKAVQEQQYPAFVKAFLKVQFPPPPSAAAAIKGTKANGSGKVVPVWVVEALEAVNISLKGSGLVLGKQETERAGRVAPASDEKETPVAPPPKRQKTAAA